MEKIAVKSQAIKIVCQKNERKDMNSGLELIMLIHILEEKHLEGK